MAAPTLATDQEAMYNSTKPTILLIHGLWMTNLSWENWVARFKNSGYPVLAESWPGIGDKLPPALRQDASPLAGLSIATIIEHYEKIIASLPRPPIIIGHSFGGLFTQILLSRGHGVAGVGICPGPPAGVLALPFSTIKSTWSVLSNPFDYNSTVPFSKSQFHYAFGNNLPEAESDIVWEKYAIPAAAHVLWQGALGGLSEKGESHVEFNKPDRAPLLLIAGTKDHVVPPKNVQKIFESYKGSAVVEVKTFDGRTHGIVNQDGWEEIADFALKWVEEHVKM